MSLTKTVFYSVMGMTMPFAAALAEEAAHQGAEAAHGSTHGGGGLPQFDFSSWPSQIFWLCIFFVILYTIFSKNILPAIGGTLQTRKDHIAGHIAEAEKLSAEARLIEESLKEHLKAAGHDASLHIQGAEQQVKARVDRALADFRARYENEIDAAENRIVNARERAMQDMESIVARLAAQMAGKLAGIETDAEQAENVVRALNKAA